MVLKPLNGCGWKINGDSLTFDWDSEGNIEVVKERVARLLKGCGCRTGCGTTRWCACKRKGKLCSEGCECTNCLNIQTASHTEQANGDILLEVTVEESVTEENETVTDDTDNVDEIMDWVFGDYGYNSSSGEDSDDLED